MSKKNEIDGTLHQFFLILKWSLEWLWKGQWPDKPFNSNRPYPAGSAEKKKALSPLAGGYFGVLWGILGDLDYMASVLGLPHYGNASNPCALCRCSSVGPNTWTDNRSTAGWIGSCWTATDWLQWPSKSKNPLFTLPGVTCLTVCLDYMHCKYLGMDQYIFGSVLFLLVNYVLTIGTPQENLCVLWDEIKGFYKQHKVPCRFKYLNRLSMFTRRNKTHKLRGKAAEIKHFAQVMAWLWERHMNPAIILHKRILLMLKKNSQMEQLLNTYKDSSALPDAEAMLFRQHAFDLAQLNNQISEHFMEEEEAHLFQVISKTHMALHCALLSKHINPRVVWCFSGEDMMKHIQTLAVSCVKGVQGPKAVNKMVQHYRLGFHLLTQQVDFQ